MKSYRGHRVELHRVTVVVCQDGQRKHALRHHIRHSPTGFNWGYTCSGSADLARCLLIDVLDDEGVDAALYQAFALAVVVGLPDNWELTEDQVRQTIEGIKTAARARAEQLEREQSLVGSVAPSAPSASTSVGGPDKGDTAESEAPE